MNITKETKLKELLTEYPWLKKEIVKVNDKCGFYVLSLSY